MVLKGAAASSPAASLPPCIYWGKAEAQLLQGLGNVSEDHPLENLSESPAYLLCTTSFRLSGGYCPASSPCSKKSSCRMLSAILTTIHHVYRVFMSPLTLRHFLRNLCLDAQLKIFTKLSAGEVNWHGSAGFSEAKSIPVAVVLK